MTALTFRLGALGAVAFMGLAGCDNDGSGDSPPATATRTATAVVVATTTPTRTPTLASTATRTHTPPPTSTQPVPTATTEPTVIPTSTPTLAATETPTEPPATPTVAATETPTQPEPTPTATATATPTEPEPTPTPTPTSGFSEQLSPGDLVVRAAFDEEMVAFRVSWGSHAKTLPTGQASAGQVYPGHFHDLLRHDGTKFDQLPSATRLQEDRVSFMIEDPGRPADGFGAAGCYMACHADMKSGADHHVIEPSTFLDHIHWRGGRSGPMGYAEDAWVSPTGRERDAAGTPPSAWLRAAGDRLREDQGALSNTQHPLAEGMPRFVFNKGKSLPDSFAVPHFFIADLDGALVTDPWVELPQIHDLTDNRSLLVVFQDRGFDPIDKVNAVDVGYLVYVAAGGTLHLPAHLQTAGTPAFLTWTSFWEADLGIAANPSERAAAAAAEDMLTEIHTEWDVESGRQALVTRSVGFVYDSDQHDVTTLRRFDTDQGTWIVTLFRKLSTERINDTDLTGLKSGSSYSLAFALHDVGGGANSHHISFPYKLGSGSENDIQANQVVDVASTDWSVIPAFATRVFQPGGQVTLDELKNPDLHPGASRVGTRPCQNCHEPDEIADLLGTSSR